MSYTECPLYGLKSKRYLKHLLHIKNNSFFNQKYICSHISPYMEKNEKTRLVEAPSEELKHIQKRIKQLLGQIDIPSNIFSGIKGRSYVDNAKIHIGSSNRSVFKIDLTAFFPSIRRETVYRFFSEDLCCAPDIATILTNLTTVDLSKTPATHLDEIYDFLRIKGITCTNHLISGSPSSQIMSYLVNHHMFDEMQKVADANNIIMTVYVDDVTFSSENSISKHFRDKIIAIVHKYGYKISKGKTKKYTKQYPKLITGVIIDPNGKLALKNSMRKKIIDEYKFLRMHPENTKSRQRLIGLLASARQVTPHVFPSIYRFAHANNPDIKIE